MLSCHEISKLVSQSLDRKLSWRQRVSLWMHLSMCRLCWGFRQDLAHLHEETRRVADRIERNEEDLGVRLPDEARERMKRELKSQQS